MDVKPPVARKVTGEISTDTKEWTSEIDGL